ncbi:DNA repair protein complementing XP-C cells-like isoform X2 [Branchiostoma lanceolatum]|uniref:DNA repair protein complementing XP-C cells-like isoform X2 n=1 Tax=Branchiostoma lanceolatum TaxID=7740 RepID=UPI003451A9EB
MGRQNRQTRRSTRTTEQNGGESEQKSLSADDHKSAVKRTSVAAGSRNKTSRKVPVVVLENLEESDLMPHKDLSNKSKKQTNKVHDDKSRNGSSVSVRKQKTVTNGSEAETCVAGKGRGKRCATKSSSGVSTQIGKEDKKGITNKRKAARKTRGQETDWIEKDDDDDFDDDGPTTTRVKKMKTNQEPETKQDILGKEKTNSKKGARKKRSQEADLMVKDNDVEDDGPGTSKVKKMKTKSQESVKDAKHHTAKVEEEEASTSSTRAEMADAPTRHPAGLKETHESSDSEFEWEEVEEIQTATKSPEKKLQDISIELSEDAIPGLFKKKKKQFDWSGYIKRQIRRISKEQRESLHKAHLLTLLACALYRSRVCNDTDLAGLALSLTPPEIVRRRRWDLGFLSKVVKWFRSKFPLVLDEEEECEDNSNCAVATLGRRLQEGTVRSENELVWLLIVVLRMLQLDTRLVISLQPIPLKESSPSKSKRNTSAQKKTSKSAPKSRGGTSKTQASKSAKQTKNAKQAKPGKRRKMTESSDDSSTERSSGKTSDPPSRRQQKTKNSRPRRRASKTKPMVEVSESDNEESDDSDYVPESSTDVKDSSSRESDVLKVEEISISSDDSDLEIIDVSKLRTKKKPGKPNQQPSRKIISEDSDESVVELTGEDSEICNEWVEVYLADEERWVTVDVVSGLVDRPEVLEQRVTRPMAYVVGVDTEGSVKDVTKRYAAGWMTSTRLLREDRWGTWWTDTLGLYSSSDKDRSKKEDIELHSKLLQKPLPTTIGEFKDHPLYALRRHLLKYDAIYPETAAVLGYCKGEPVYARECVHQLHTRDKWLQEARVVRSGEVPYKMVKHNNPNWLKRKMERQGIFTTGNADEPTVALFVRWQTEDYMPPLAVDGKVPRNDYGNVDLYLPCMLPQGTVHLQIPGLERVARKLDIDCAPAVVGFDFHSGWSHPVKDGYIVCEEHKGLLIAAWEEDRQNREQKVKEKREKRSLDNWRKLTKALLISQRLKRRFQIQNESKVKSSEEGEDIDDDDDDDDNGDETSDRAVDVEKSWPRRDFGQEATSSKTHRSRGKKGQKEDAHLFPFEKL